MLRTFRFAYRPLAPYLFSAHLERFSLGDKPSPWLYDGKEKRAWRLLSIGGGSVGVAIRFQGEPWDPALVVEVVAPGKGLARAGYEAVLRILRVDFDYNLFLERLRGFPGLYELAARYPGLRPGRCLSLYNALVDSIVKQRVALRAALRAMARLVESYSPRLIHGSRVFYDYPSAEELAKAPLEEIRSHGLTRTKARAIHEIALAETENRLPSIEEIEKDPLGAVEELQGIYGVGPWTAELAVAMVLGRFLVGPRTDLAVRRGLQRVLGIGGSEAERILRELGEVAGLIMYLAAYNYEEAKRGKEQGP